MISSQILNTLKQYAEQLSQAITLQVQRGEHRKRTELLSFLTDIASTSDKITLVEGDYQLASPISFRIAANARDTGIRFSGIPSGHEFNSLVLALLQAGGSEIKLDDNVKEIIQSINEDLYFEAFISLSCHNCPDAVQAINQFALLNDKISAEMIDGGLFQELVDERDIQGVPSLFLNGKLFATGKLSAADLLAKLQAQGYTQKKASQQLPLQDISVIGGGPAGIAAAIYSARKGLKVTLIADRIGGQVKDTMDIENLIALDKTTGPQLSSALMQNLNNYDITIKEHLVVEHIENGDIKSLHLSSGEIIKSKTLIAATGAKWRELGVPGEKENIGQGVAYCPHCDGPFFKGRDVAVVGGGNSGIEAALDLAGIARSVTVFEYLDSLKADKVLVDKAHNTANITLLTNVRTDAIHASNNKVNAISYTDRVTNETLSLSLDGVFVQIGLLPNSQVFKGIVETTQHDEIIINEKCETSSKGIFACGDVSTVPYKQIVVAMGEGAKASLAAFEYLLQHGDNLSENKDRKLTINAA